MRLHDATECATIQSILLFLHTRSFFCFAPLRSITNKSPASDPEVPKNQYETPNASLSESLPSSYPPSSPLTSTNNQKARNRLLGVM